MSATQYEQFDFSLGEISPDYDWRADLKVRAKSLRSARNVRTRYTGSGEVRPGSDRLFAASGDGWIEFANVDGVAYGMVFTAAQVKIYTRADRTLVATLTGCPWTADLLDEIVVASWGKQAFVFHQGFATQILERADDGTWSRTPWAPAAGPGDTTRQPFYRYAAKGITVTPGALTGTGVALVASADAFTAGMVGLRLRLQNREVEIASFVDAQNVTVDVKQDLHETVELDLDRTDGFSVGEIVEGATTGARAEVVSVDSGTQITVLKLDFTEFYYEGAGMDKREFIVGPNTKSRVTAAESAPVTPAAVLDWTEQAMSDHRGWPACGTVHQSRLWMARLPLVPYGVLASEIDDFTAMEVGTGDSDAIFEEIRDANVGRIRWLAPSENLLVLTEERTYWIQTPTPTGIAFTPIDPPGASGCKPVVLSEGIAFSEKGGAELIGLFPTGDVRRSWRTQSLSYLAAHLIASPRSMAYVSPSDNSPERQVYMANADGTATVLTYTETDADALPSLVPWTVTGTWRCFAAAEGECWALVLRSGSYQVEAFSTERYMDGVVDSATLQGAATTQTISTPSGTLDAEFVWRAGEYAGRTCSLMVDGAYIGEVTLDGSGDFGTPEGDVVLLGFKFAVECVPWPPMDAQDQTARRRKKRIGPVNLRWKGRYITVDGNLQPVYRAEDDMNLVPPLRDETIRVPTFGGWQDSPTVTIGHPYPGPFILLGLSCEVTG